MLLMSQGNENNNSGFTVGRKSRQTTCVNGDSYKDQGNFNQDQKIAKKTERKMMFLMCDTLTSKRFLRSAWCARVNEDYRYDFMLGLYNGNISRDAFHLTFEVKEDQKCAQTKNVGVEFMCCKKPSGISTSEADFYIYHVHTGYESTDRKTLLIRTEDLKKAIQDRRYHRIVTSYRDGDHRPADNYLFYLTEMEKIASCVVEHGNKESIKTAWSVIDEKVRELVNLKQTSQQQAVSF